MPRLKAANNAITTLVSGIDAVVTSFTVTDASKFPEAPFRITIDAEIMEVGAIDKGNNIFSNVQRGLEGTTAASHNAGATIENRWTAGTYDELVDANHTHTRSQITDFAHKSTHASGGADALTPADIGAETPAGAQAKVDIHADRTDNPHLVTKAQVGLGNVVDKEQVNAIAVGSTSDPNTTQEPYILTNHANSPGGGVYWHIHTYFYRNKTGNRAQIAIQYNGTGDNMYIRHYYGGSWTAWTKVWHAGNDGPGSGLDADKLKGSDHRGVGGEVEHPVATTTTAGFMSADDKKKLDGEITQNGYVVYNESIAGQSYVTKTIALDRGDYKRGILTAVRTTGPYSPMGAIVFFATDNNLAKVFTNSRDSDHSGATNRRLDGAYVIANYESTLDVGVGVLDVDGQIGLTECYIDGNQIKLTFYNKHVDAKTLDVVIDWEVWP